MDWMEHMRRMNELLGIPSKPKVEQAAKPVEEMTLIERVNKALADLSCDDVNLAEFTIDIARVLMRHKVSPGVLSAFMSREVLSRIPLDIFPLIEAQASLENLMELEALKTQSKREAS